MPPSTDQPLATYGVLLITAAVTAWGFAREEVRDRFVLRTDLVLGRSEYHRLLSSALLHGSWGHFLLNAFSLVSFGPSIEQTFGVASFLLIYLVAVVGGSALAVVAHRREVYAALGASGGVCGVIFAAVFLLPETRVSLLFIPIFVPGWVFALAFLALSFLGAQFRWGNIGHEAHLGGALAGLGVATVLYPAIVRSGGSLYFGVVALGIVLAALLVAYPRGGGRAG